LGVWRRRRRRRRRRTRITGGEPEEEEEQEEEEEDEDDAGSLHPGVCSRRTPAGLLHFVLRLHVSLNMITAAFKAEI